MIKKATAVLTLLVLCGLLPATAQEAQPAQPEMKAKAKEAMGEAGEMADKAKAKAEEAKTTAKEAESMADEAEAKATEMAGEAEKKAAKMADEAKGKMDEAGEVMAADATLEEVLESHYEAVGGVDAWKSVEAVRLDGIMRMGPGMEAPFTITMKRPENIRLEFQVQGMTGIQASNGTTSWMVMPFMGKTDPEEMPADMAEQFKQQADIEGPLFDWAAKGHQVELVGKVKMEGTDAYQVKVTRENGDVSHQYLDTDHYMVFKQEGRANVQGQQMDIETDLGDYKEVCLATSTEVDDDNPCEGDRLILAYSIESKPKGMPSGQAITINSVTINPDDVADDYFAMPAKKAADSNEAAKSGE